MTIVVKDRSRYLEIYESMARKLSIDELRSDIQREKSKIDSGKSNFMDKLEILINEERTRSFI